MPDTDLDAEFHRRMAARLFNRTWELLETEGRTAEQDDEMLHAAHASRYHWGVTGRWPNMAAGEWQCSRVYAVLKRVEPCLWHAKRCHELAIQHGLGDYGYAAALEAMARACLLAGDEEAARAWRDRGLEACKVIAEPEDAAPIFADLMSLPFREASAGNGS